ncbi:MAG: Gfo/Idh/MocA family oxidoreductase [Verrucomicrobiales bacterium]|nr:Gfo/Idh/MocA family oxidoreductase [Verrucomicrobiales bacterium]
MKPLRFAIAGAGFWSRFQLAGWREIEGAQCVAVYNRTRSKAEALAREFGVPAVYENFEALLDRETLDFVDVVTNVETHAALVMEAARRRLPVICQKPLAPDLDTARAMVDACGQSGTPLLVHENWRWQAPIRAMKRVLDSGRLGRVVRARIDYAHSFPVFENQPFLREVEQFILADMGTHLLDVARFLWGEARELYCQTRRMHPDIRGEDVATVVMRMAREVTVTVNMSYASRWEFDRFPETFIAVEGSDAGASLTADGQLRIFGVNGVEEQRVRPAHYAWADPAYAAVHASIVDCHRNLFGSLRGEGAAETTGEDNLRTLELVFGAYRSARSRAAIDLSA